MSDILFTPDPREVAFGKLAAELMTKIYRPAVPRLSLKLGRPRREHQFTFGTPDRRIVGAARQGGWSDQDELPRNPWAAANEAVWYLSLVRGAEEKVLCLPCVRRWDLPLSVANIYHRLHRHLLRGIMVFEINPATRKVYSVNEESSSRAFYAEEGAAPPAGT